MAEATIHIKGMSCGHCVKQVRDAISTVDGVSEIHISLKEASARIVYDETRADTDLIARKINAIGYQADQLNS